MLNFNRIIFISIFAIFMGCQTESKNNETKVSAEPQIVSSEFQSYNITESLTVNSVVAILYNPGESKTIKFMVELQQGEESWTDTIAYYAKENDTARHHVIFAESIFSKEKPAAFNSKIVAVVKQSKAE